MCTYSYNERIRRHAIHPRGYSNSLVSVTHFSRDEEEPAVPRSECLLVQLNRTEYNTDPHSKYALLVSAAANIDIRVIREAES